MTGNILSYSCWYQILKHFDLFVSCPKKTHAHGYFVNSYKVQCIKTKKNYCIVNSVLTAFLANNTDCINWRNELGCKTQEAWKFLN